MPVYRYDVARHYEEIVYIAEDKSIYTTCSFRSKCVIIDITNSKILLD